MLKSELYRALRTKLHRHDFSTFVDEPQRSGRAARRKSSMEELDRILPIICCQVIVVVARITNSATTDSK
jgi:hypothetical protein